MTFVLGSSLRVKESVENTGGLWGVPCEGRVPRAWEQWWQHHLTTVSVTPWKILHPSNSLWGLAVLCSLPVMDALLLWFLPHLQMPPLPWSFPWFPLMSLVSPSFLITFILWSKSFMVLNYPTTKNTVLEVAWGWGLYLAHLDNLHRTKGNALVIVSWS